MVRLLAAEDVDLIELIPQWERSLGAENKSPRTVRAYGDGARRLRAFLYERGMPTTPAHIAREHIEAFIEDVLARWTDSTAATHYRNVQQLFNWLVEVGEVTAHPMARMRPPKIGEKEIPIIPGHDLEALLGACAGREFEDLRDTAILRLYLSTGLRPQEGANLRMGDIDPDTRTVTVTGKGNRVRIVLLLPATVKALDRYLRIRRRHPAHAREPWVWLGPKGRLTGSGIAQMLRRRSREAGITPHVRPHQLRHTWAHNLKSRGMAEDEMKYLGGWKTSQMLGRYASSAVGERARASLDRLGDRL
jgi:site-specific recombinase XerD